MIVDPPFIFTFFTVYTTRIHTLGALQHYNAWNFTGILLILAHVAWIVDISMDILHISSGFMDLLHITRMVKQGLQVSIILIIACSCLDGD